MKAIKFIIGFGIALTETQKTPARVASTIERVGARTKQNQKICCVDANPRERLNVFGNADVFGMAGPPPVFIFPQKLVREPPKLRRFHEARPSTLSRKRHSSAPLRRYPTRRSLVQDPANSFEVGSFGDRTAKSIC